jgi:hypothetical protein
MLARIAITVGIGTPTVAVVMNILHTVVRACFPEDPWPDLC